jgi:hypothetical protein
MATILEGEGRTFWVAADGTSTYYLGQVCSYIAASKAMTTGTLLPLAVPAGAFDLTNYQVIAGIVTGIDDRNPTYDPTTGLQYVTGTYQSQAQLAARSTTGVEGMYKKGDNQVHLQITEILPTTVIRMPIFNAAYGTAPTLLTATAGATTGGTTAWTTNACDFTNVASMGTVFCRGGANAGSYRVSKDTSTTAPSVNTAFDVDVAIGDTFVRVPIKQGSSTAYIDGPGLYIDCSKNPVIAGTTLFNIIVYNLDLKVAGSEVADFRFGMDHFCIARA